MIGVSVSPVLGFEQLSLVDVTVASACHLLALVRPLWETTSSLSKGGGAVLGARGIHIEP